MRITITIRRFRFYFANFAHKLRIPHSNADSATAQFYYAYILWFVCGIWNLFRIPQILLRIPQIRLLFEWFWAVQCFRCLFVESKTGKKTEEK